MPYRFATDNLDFGDFSAGRVLYNQPGLPAFPVRLASEILQRAEEHLTPAGGLNIYDPTCGGAYHLTALGFLHGAKIRALSASDADERALALARRNLGLLSAEGLAQRESELKRMLADYGKQSHADALRSLAALRELRQGQPGIATRVFEANALDPSALAAAVRGAAVDLVISDIPYGQMSGWLAASTAREDKLSPASQMLEALIGVLTARSVVAIAADKAQKIQHPRYRRLEQFKVGKRQVTLLRLDE